MAEITLLQMPPFKQVYKKLHQQQKIEVDAAIKQIIQEPTVGEKKKGDLSNIWVHKFKINTQEFLLAYEWEPKKRVLLLLGTHENFYRNLKR